MISSDFKKIRNVTSFSFHKSGIFVIFRNKLIGVYAQYLKERRKSKKKSIVTETFGDYDFKQATNMSFDLQILVVPFLLQRVGP